MLLVTGGAGYIGSHTVRALQARGYETLVLDNFVKGHRDLVFGPLVEGDLRDEALLDGLFEKYPVDGWCTLPPSASWGSPWRTPRPT